MADWLDGEISRLGPVFSKYFFNELLHPEAAGGVVAPVTWEGFPRYWNLQYPHSNAQKWKASEVLQKYQGQYFRYQDEYLEWRGEYQGGKLVKVTFTCEGPEYWDFLAANDMPTTLALYNSFTGANVTEADIMTGSGASRKYNRFNKWNTTDGIIHLTQPNNTLGAEVNLAAQAAVVRKNATSNPITDPLTLINCSKYGDADRFSDPTIGAAVNSFVRQGSAVTLNNPIGLYIHKLKTAGIQLPPGRQLSEFWTVIRGDAAKGIILRAEFAVPAGAAFTLEDVTVGGTPLTYGAQLAELVEMVIYAKAFDPHTGVPAAVTCGGSLAAAPAHALLAMTEEVQLTALTDIEQPVSRATKIKVDEL